VKFLGDVALDQTRLIEHQVGVAGIDGLEWGDSADMDIGGDLAADLPIDQGVHLWGVVVIDGAQQDHILAGGDDIVIDLLDAGVAFEVSDRGLVTLECVGRFELGEEGIQIQAGLESLLFLVFG